jgi:signal transduction histidine kinase
MSRLARTMKLTYSWLRPEGPITISNGVLLYAPNVVRAAAIIFCVVGIIFSVPYSLEHWGDLRLIFTRLFVVALACLATGVVSLWIEKYYRACVLACTLIGTSVTLLTTTYMDGPNINPHAMLVAIFVLGAGLCLGRQGVIITLGWLILNYLLLNIVASLGLWPHPASISVGKVQYENVSATFFILLSLTPVLLGYLAVVERSITELRKSYSDQAHLLQRLIATQESERKQLSHILHEGPVQDLGALRWAIHNEQSPKELIPLVDSAIRELRELSTSLHPAILDHYGLPAALDQLATQRGGAFKVEVHSHRLGRLDPHVEIALFRIAQEALTNIQKHSNAQHVWIQLEKVKDTLVLEIRDDGVGFDAAPTMRRSVQDGHLGLATVHELAASIDGKLEITSSPRRGTTIRVTAPYRSGAIPPQEPSTSTDSKVVTQQEENRSLV